MIEFFTYLGEIRSIIVGEFQNNFSVIPPVYEWWVTQYDIDSAISNKDLNGQSPVLNISTSLRNGVQIKWLGHLFYIYIKNRPDLGQVCRFEERIFPEKKPLAEGIKEILDSPPPFSKAVDLIDNEVDKKDWMTSMEFLRPLFYPFFEFQSYLEI